MGNVVHKISDVTLSNQNKLKIMIVSEVLNGEATVLIDDTGFELRSDSKSDATSFMHASSVPVLSIGDKIIVSDISNNFIVTDKIRTLDEKPTVGFEFNNDGSLSLYSSANIKLKSNKAKIEILKNGKILIDGHEVYSLSNGINRIQGSTIELN